MFFADIVLLAGDVQVTALTTSEEYVPIPRLRCFQLVFFGGLQVADFFIIQVFQERLDVPIVEGGTVWYSRFPLELTHQPIVFVVF